MQVKVEFELFSLLVEKYKLNHKTDVIPFVKRGWIVLFVVTQQWHFPFLFHSKSLSIGFISLNNYLTMYTIEISLFYTRNMKASQQSFQKSLISSERNTCCFKRQLLRI